MSRSELPDVDESSLQFVSMLGEGGFGSVSLMIDSKSRLYAEKSSPLYLLENLDKEKRIMQRFRNHPRIVQLTNPNLHISTKPDRCFIYMEFASKGTLHNVISQFRRNPMPEMLVGRVALMILQGLDALHSHGYVHCDIKPGNILLFPSKVVGEPWDLKLGDFGLSKEPCSDSRSLSAGTMPYMPPESLGPNGVISSAVDIWSLACVVLEMFGARPQHVGGLFTWRLLKPVSPMARDFLNRCMELKPSRRATVKELLNHPFVAPRVLRMGPSFLRVPSVTRNNVMGEVSRRQRGPPMMKLMMVPRPGNLIC